MSKAQKQLHQFKSLAKKFEPLIDEIRTCTNPARRIELLQRMRLLIDETDSYVVASLDQENQQPRPANANLMSEESAS